MVSTIKMRHELQKVTRIVWLIPPIEIYVPWYMGEGNPSKGKKRPLFAQNLRSFAENPGSMSCLKKSKPQLYWNL
jgi:hypothetical protein